MQTPISLGFIGCGGHAVSSHAEVVVNMPEFFKIVKVFDVNKDAAQNLLSTVSLRSSAERFAWDIYELVNSFDVDAVVIVTPHRFHLEQAEKAIEAGKHVLLEKPLFECENKELLGVYTERLVKLLKRAGEKGLVFTSCHPRRFEPVYVRVRKEMERYHKKYGRLLACNFMFSYHKPSTEWKLLDSLALDHANHEVDLVHFLYAPDAMHVECVQDGPDWYHAVGSTNDGAKICFSGTRRLEERLYRNELELVFERGRVRTESVLKDGVVDACICEEDFDPSELWIKKNEHVRTYTHPCDIAFRGIMRNFANAILGQEPNYLTPEDLLRNTVAANALKGCGAFDSWTLPRL